MKSHVRAKNPTPSASTTWLLPARDRLKRKLAVPRPRLGFEFSSINILHPSSTFGRPEHRSGEVGARLPLRAPCQCEKEEEETASPRPDETGIVTEFGEDDPLGSWIVGGKATPVAGGKARTVNEGPLRSWVVGGPAVAGTNTIKCDGSGGIVVQADGTGNAQQTACTGSCIVEHEQSHRADALAANANICDGIASGRSVTVNTAAERKATEVKASNVELRCLRALPDTDECRDIVAARVRQMIAYRDSF